MSDERPEMTEDERAPSRCPAHVLHDATSGTADKVSRRMEAIAQPATFTPTRPRDDASLDDRDHSGRRDRAPLRRQAVAVGLILVAVGSLVVFEVGYIVRRSVQRDLAPAQAIVVSPSPRDAPQATVAPPSRPAVGNRTAITPVHEARVCSNPNHLDLDRAPTVLTVHVSRVALRPIRGHFSGSFDRCPPRISVATNDAVRVGEAMIWVNRSINTSSQRQNSRQILRVEFIGDQVRRRLTRL